jgi:hypothetical protein
MIAMGIYQNSFDCLSVENMPVGYPEIRMGIKMWVGSIMETRDIMKEKVSVVSGMSAISPENVNKLNSKKSNIFREYINRGFPYIEQEDPEEAKKGDDSLESLIEEYKRLFPANVDKEDK